MTQTISIRDIKRAMSTEPSLVMQRRAAAWLDRLRTFGVAEGFLPVAINGLDIDVLNALRSPIILRGSLALRQVRAIRTIEDRVSGAVHLTDDDEDVRVGEIAGAIGIKQVRRPTFEREALRRSLYRMRRGLRQRAASRLSQKEMPRVDVIAFPRMASHLRDQAPVLDELVRSMGWRVTVVHVDARAASAAAALGFESMPLFGFASPGDGELDALALRAQVASALRSSNDKEDLLQSEVGALKYVARRTVRDAAGEVARLVYATRAMVANLRPKLVLVGNPYTYEGRIVADTSRKVGVPVASIEHGSIFPGDPQWHECPLDTMCAWGESSAEALIASGVARRKIVITGSPRLDDALAAHRVDKAKRYVLVATSGPGDVITLAEHLRFIDELIEAAGQKPDIVWRVRLHPKDRAAYYLGNERFRATPNIELAGTSPDQDVTIYEALAEAHALVTLSSTTAVEAMVCGVPAVVMEAGAREQLAAVEYLSPKRTYHVSTAAALAATVGELVHGRHDPARAASASDYVAQHFAHRGEASACVAAALVRTVRVG